MPWATFIPIIAQYGLPFAINLFQKWTNGGIVTQSEIDELSALAKEKADDIMKSRLVAAGVPLTLCRLSVGIENVDDLWRDLEQAISKILK